MDYKDLQINDWVYLSEAAKYAMQVASIDKYECSLDFEGNAGDPFLAIYGEGGIAPIPLTEEMIALNGWRAGVEGDYYLGGGFEFLEWRTDSKAFYLNNAPLPYELEWVHQLQHILRLLGYNDIADNFKIK